MDARRESFFCRAHVFDHDLLHHSGRLALLQLTGMFRSAAGAGDVVRPLRGPTRLSPLGKCVQVDFVDARLHIVNARTLGHLAESTACRVCRESCSWR